MSYDLSDRLLDPESPPLSRSQVVHYLQLTGNNYHRGSRTSRSLNEHPLSDSFGIWASSRRSPRIYHAILSPPRELVYVFEAVSSTGNPLMAIYRAVLDIQESPWTNGPATAPHRCQVIHGGRRTVQRLQVVFEGIVSSWIRRSRLHDLEIVGRKPVD